jgi:hypothetical protein
MMAKELRLLEPAKFRCNIFIYAELSTLNKYNSID